MQLLPPPEEFVGITPILSSQISWTTMNQYMNEYATEMQSDCVQNQSQMNVHCPNNINNLVCLRADIRNTRCILICPPVKVPHYFAQLFNVYSGKTSHLTLIDALIIMFPSLREAIYSFLSEPKNTCKKGNNILITLPLAPKDQKLCAI